MAILAAGIIKSCKPTGINGDPQEVRSGQRRSEDSHHCDRSIHIRTVEVNQGETSQNGVRRLPEGALTHYRLSTADPRGRVRPYNWIY